MGECKPFSGLNESAAAIRYFTDKTTALIDEVTLELPWRIELMLYDIEEHQTVITARESAEQITSSTASIAATAAKLPADLDAILAARIDQIDTKQEGLRQTLQDADKTVASVHAALDQAQEAVTAVNSTVTNAQGLIEGLNETSANLTAAGIAWDATFKTLGLGGEDDEGEEGAGAEYAWSWARVRGGYRLDMQGEAKNVFTAGLGLTAFGVFNFELAGMFGNKTVGGVLQATWSF